jgi:LacI family transcriptional regulator
MSTSDLRGSGLSGVPEPELSQVPEPELSQMPEPRSSGLREPGAGGGPEAGAVSGPHASDRRDVAAARDTQDEAPAPDTRDVAAARDTQDEAPAGDTQYAPGHPLPDILLVPQPHPAAVDASRSGASPVTLYDVARLAGVSTATVSRVVHGQDRVAEGTRARVRDVIDQLGYVPDGAAQSLSRRQKHIIGLVGVERVAPHQYDIESMSLLFYDEILRGVEQRIRYHNWSLLFTYLREEGNDDWHRLQSLLGKVDGLLIGEGIVPADEMARLAKRLPVVVVAGDPAEEAADVVTADNRSGSAALVRHLVEVHGRRRIFHVDGPPTAPDAKERRLALNDVIQAHHGVDLVGSHSGRFSVESGEEAGEKLLAERAALPDAIVCANDQMAIGVLQALARGGVRVPEDLSVTGFDDIFPGSLFEPSLTTVHQPMRLLGERACARLLDRIAQPDLPQQVELLPTALVLRKSCGCPPGSAARTLTPQPGTAGLTTGTVIEAPASRGRRHARPTRQS